MQTRILGAPLDLFQSRSDKPILPRYSCRPRRGNYSLPLYEGGMTAASLRGDRLYWRRCNRSARGGFGRNSTIPKWLFSLSKCTIDTWVLEFFHKNYAPELFKCRFRSLIYGLTMGDV
jgi:hypothetical protein